MFHFEAVVALGDQTLKLGSVGVAAEALVPGKSEDSCPGVLGCAFVSSSLKVIVPV